MSISFLTSTNYTIKEFIAIAKKINRFDVITVITATGASLTLPFGTIYDGADRKIFQSSYIDTDLFVPIIEKELERCITLKEKQQDPFRAFLFEGIIVDLTQITSVKWFGESLMTLRNKVMEFYLQTAIPQPVFEIMKNYLLDEDKPEGYS